MFQKIIISLARRTNSAYEFVGENVAHLIERDQNGKPSKNVWQKTFILNGDNVTVKVHGKQFIVPLASLV